MHLKIEEKYPEEKGIEIGREEREVKNDGTGHADDPGSEGVEEEEGEAKPSKQSTHWRAPLNPRHLHTLQTNTV